MSTITFNGHELQIQPIPVSWSEYSEEQIETLLRLFYGTSAKIISTEDGKRTVTWVVPQHKERA